MKEDSSLFKYELAIAAILKNEGPYVKEWVEYHLLAGVEHFYIYDNESPDNLKQEIQSYIDAGVVDYTFLPGQCTLMVAFNDAIDKHKFDCRYIAFLDGDEYILPRGNVIIQDIVHQMLDDKKNAVSLTMNWHTFGSNGLEKAEYEKSVLERFTTRTPDNFDVDKKLGNGHVKTIVNPRCVDIFHISHCPVYYPGKFSIDENNKVVPGYFNPDVPDKKIVINHYQMKSKEEYVRKISRGHADSTTLRPKMEDFIHTNELSTVYDDSILQYRQQRYEQLSDPEGNLTLQFDSSEAINRRLFNAVAQHILPLTFAFTSNEPFGGKLHEFLTCRAVSNSLKNESALDESTAEFFEELSLRCVYRSMSAGDLEIWQLMLLLDELPKILNLEYDVVDDIKNACRQLIPQLMMQYRMHADWNKYKQLNYLLKMLEE